MVNQSESIARPEPLNLETRLLLVGLLLGLMADRLLWESGLIGPGFLAWLILFSTAALWIKQQRDGVWSIAMVTWSIVALAAATLLLFRTTDLLMLLLWLVILIAAAMVFLQLTAISLRQTTVADYLEAQFRVFFHAAVGIMPIVKKIDLRFGFSTPRLWAIIRGVLIVAPLLVVFASLFASADAVFSGYLQKLTDIFSPQLPRHIFMTLFFAWMATGLMAAVCLKPRSWNFGEKLNGKLGAEETTVIMGALVVLFVSFVLLQLSYLFGGREVIESTSDLTVAQYARRGFFELVTVAALILAVLIAFASTCGEQRMFRPLARTLVACVLVILISAAQRMVLYVDSFGLTIDRLTVLTFMIWLGFSLIMFTFTVLQGRSKDFVISLSVVGIVLVFLFALINPAALVARVNIERSIVTEYKVDVYHLLGLGADAVPTIMDNLSQLHLPPEDECVMAGKLLDWTSLAGHYDSNPKGWRSWNASRAAARKAVLVHQEQLTAINQRCRLTQ